MSVICKDLTKPNMVAYTKGAPEKIKVICNAESLPKNYNETLSWYTAKGFRVISIAYKVLPKSFKWKDAQKCDREMIECDLAFIGFLIMQNPLKPETTPVIRTLHQANLRTVMITGDNLLTAIAVAYNCEMVKPYEQIFVLTVKSYENSPSKISLTKASGQINDENVVVNITDNAYHFAIDGENWRKLLIEFPELVPLLLVRTDIFARIQPDQKTEIVKEFQNIDYVVCMVGDGANDCGALKAAHVGVSLSQAESSVAAPFTSSIENISCIIHLLLEGRCALVTSFAIFKYMALYSFIQFFSIIILYKKYSNMGDYQFFYIDFFITTLLALTMGYQGPSDKLCIKRPLSSLISPRNIIPLLLQISVCGLIQLSALYFLSLQPWYVPISPHDDEPEVVSWENTVIFTVSCHQFIILATVYSKGKPYRQMLIKNGWFIISALVLTAISSWLMLMPCKWVAEIMELVPVDSSETDKFLFKFYLIVFPAVHLFIAFTIEIGIADRVWMQKFIQLLKRKKVPKNRYKSLLLTANYECWLNFHENAT